MSWVEEARSLGLSSTSLDEKIRLARSLLHRVDRTRLSLFPQLISAVVDQSIRQLERKELQHDPARWELWQVLVDALCAADPSVDLVIPKRFVEVISQDLNKSTLVTTVAHALVALLSRDNGIARMELDIADLGSVLESMLRIPSEDGALTSAKDAIDIVLERFKELVARQGGSKRCFLLCLNNLLRPAYQRKVVSVFSGALDSVLESIFHSGHLGDFNATGTPQFRLFELCNSFSHEEENQGLPALLLERFAISCRKLSFPSSEKHHQGQLPASESWPMKFLDRLLGAFLDSNPPLSNLGPVVVVLRVAKQLDLYRNSLRHYSEGSRLEQNLKDTLDRSLEVPCDRESVVELWIAATNLSYELVEGKAQDLIEKISEGPTSPSLWDRLAQFHRLVCLDLAERRKATDMFQISETYFMALRKGNVSVKPLRENIMHALLQLDARVLFSSVENHYFSKAGGSKDLNWKCLMLETICTAIASLETFSSALHQGESWIRWVGRDLLPSLLDSRVSTSEEMASIANSYLQVSRVVRLYVSRVGPLDLQLYEPPDISKWEMVEILLTRINLLCSTRRRKRKRASLVGNCISEAIYLLCKNWKHMELDRIRNCLGDIGPLLMEVQGNMIPSSAQVLFRTLLDSPHLGMYISVFLGDTGFFERTDLVESLAEETRVALLDQNLSKTQMQAILEILRQLGRHRTLLHSKVVRSVKKRMDFIDTQDDKLQIAMLDFLLAALPSLTELTKMEYGSILVKLASFKRSSFSRDHTTLLLEHLVENLPEDVLVTVGQELSLQPNVDLTNCSHLLVAMITYRLGTLGDHPLLQKLRKVLRSFESPILVELEIRDCQRLSVQEKLTIASDFIERHESSEDLSCRAMLAGCLIAGKAICSRQSSFGVEVGSFLNAAFSATTSSPARSILRDRVLALSLVALVSTCPTLRSCASICLRGSNEWNLVYDGCSELLRGHWNKATNSERSRQNFSQHLAILSALLKISDTFAPVYALRSVFRDLLAVIHLAGSLEQVKAWLDCAVVLVTIDPPLLVSLESMGDFLVALARISTDWGSSVVIPVAEILAALLKRWSKMSNSYQASVALIHQRMVTTSSTSSEMESLGRFYQSWATRGEIQCRRRWLGNAVGDIVNQVHSSGNPQNELALRRPGLHILLAALDTSMVERLWASLPTVRANLLKEVYAKFAGSAKYKGKA